MHTLDRPAPRGPLSEHLLQVLSGRPGPVAGLAASTRRALAAGSDVATDEDVQLALTVLYELHYRGIRGVDDRWEWSPDLIATRTLIEDAFEAELRAAVRDRPGPPQRPQDVPAALFALVGADDGPSLSDYLARQATAGQFREFLTHRSLYHLKEADPHTWAIPRLAGAAKAALLEIQADEYGGGRPERMHAALFATAMRGAGLDDGYGAQLDRLPAVTLAWANAFSLLGLHRRLRGATAGHLAALEMTSSLPNARYARGVRRLGLPEETAAHDLAGRLVLDEPDLAADVFFGAAVALHTDARVAAHLLACWEAGHSSLRPVRGGLPAGRPEVA
jgi:heme oxygenase-like protein